MVGSNRQVLHKLEYETIDGELIACFRHKNPDGSLGGLIAETATVPETCYVHPTSWVGPDVTLSEHSEVPAYVHIQREDSSSFSYIVQGKPTDSR